jgi:TonB family protein
VLSSIPSWALVLMFLSTFGAAMFRATSGASTRLKQDPNVTAPATAVAQAAYPDTARGLENLVGEIFRASKKNDTATYNALISSLSQPVPAEWFRNTFGDDGETMLQQYPGAGPRITSALQAFFAKLQNEKFTQATAQKHEASCDDNSGELIYPVMVMRQRSVPLYELRFHEGDKFYRLWALAYVDSGFRFVGELHPPDFRGGPAKTGGPSDKSEDFPREYEKRIRIGGSVSAARLVHRVQPEYPETARRERLQGTVRLHAVIAKDGTIRLLRVQTGYCSLGEAAMRAVRQWRYTPTLLEGMPVEVDTTIDVVFSLRS